MGTRQFYFASFRLDPANEQLWEGEALVPVRPKLFAVLRCLVEHAGRLVTREELLRAAWPTTVVSDSVLRGTIRELREVLRDDATAARFVETVPHRGYRFLAPVTAAVSPGQPSQAPVRKPEGRAHRSSPLPIPDIRRRTLDVVRLVGRDAELIRLHRSWEKALQGERQVVFVTGEPGIGKTTVVDAFLAAIAPPGAWVTWGQCVEHYGVGEAYLPVLEAFGRLCRQPQGQSVIGLLHRHAPTWLVQMPALLGDDELESLQRRVQGATRERMLREMADALEALAHDTPLVLVLEDLHWSDSSTLDLISVVAQRREPARLLLLATYRPADLIMSQHPLRALKQELQVHRRCEELPLGFLNVEEVTRYLAARFSRQHFPPGLGPILHRSTEGSPLFMVNLVDDWVRQGLLVET
jgi:DNA-binding winged helix-turn-helix (wHTH) protein